MEVNELSPALFYKYFCEIAEIPHGSGNTQQLTEYLCDFAEENGFSYETDEAGNVLIRGEATEGYEDHAPVLLQGHMDMVCVSEEGYEHDFESEPLSLVRDGDYLYAEGTSLGADDAVAIASMMAVLTDPQACHPALECLATVDEETGMDGALSLDPSWITARRMLNMDSEEEGVLIAGCAGGAEVVSGIPLDRVTLKGGCYRITVSGLCGGHSGSEIIMPHISANKLMGRILRDLVRDYAVSIVSLKGGEKMNAIATSAECVVLADVQDQSDLISYCAELTEKLRREYASSEEDVVVRCIPEGPGVVAALSFDSTEKVAMYLDLVPHGLYQLLAEPEGIAALSTNLGQIAVQGDLFTATSLVRGAVRSAKLDLCERILSLTEFLGGDAEIQGEYPEWPYQPDSSLLAQVCDVYEKKFGQQCFVTVTHGGLECGLLSEKIPDLEIVSFGPELYGIHTPAERLSISSMERTYDFLLAILADM